jgi:DNA-binding transcriptional MerR regulator
LLLTFELVSIKITFMAEKSDQWAGMARDGELLSLDELVERANALLPRYLPAEVDDARMREEVNPRLVRHLTSLGLLDEAGREGREARYGLRHLLQLLVARRLMAQGFTTAAISGVVSGQSDEQLKSLLLGDLHLTMQISPAAQTMPAPQREKNEALEYLQKFARPRRVATDASRVAPAAPIVAPAAPIVAPPPACSAPYLRMEVKPGLELHVADDFRLPSSPHERDVLLQEILQRLKTAASAGRSRRKK